jgi:colanic acid biosynthesis glycosyl transferase WcaI
MRVAIVGINYAPDPTGIPVYTTGMAEHLAAQGHGVRVYTGFPYYPRWTKAPEDRGRLFRRETRNGVQVRRHYLYVPSRPSAVRRMLHELSFVASASLGYLFGARADLTIIVSPPLFLGLPIALIAKLKGSRTVFHVQDLQPDAAIDLGMLEPGLLTRFFHLVEKATYRAVDHVSTISYGMLEKIASKGVPRHKLALFRNWAHDDLVQPMGPDTGYRREWRLGERFVVLYSGNMGVKQGLDSLIEAAAELRANRDIVFVIVGDGGEKPALMARAQALQLDNVQFHPLQPMERLSELLATADVAVVPQKRGVKDIVLPSKLGNLLASGRPVIAGADAGTEFGRIVAESGCGLLVEPGNAGQLAAAVSGLSVERGECRRMGQEGRRYMETNLGSRPILEGFARWTTSVAQRA